jgi:hypothetical protein
MCHRKLVVLLLVCVGRVYSSFMHILTTGLICDRRMLAGGTLAPLQCRACAWCVYFCDTVQGAILRTKTVTQLIIAAIAIADLPRLCACAKFETDEVLSCTLSHRHAPEHLAASAYQRLLRHITAKNAYILIHVMSVEASFLVTRTCSSCLHQ